MLPVLAVLSVLSAGLAGAVAWYTFRRASGPGRTAFGLTMTGAAVWAGGYGLGLAVTDATLRVGAEPVVWLGKTVMPVTWVVFALQYTGRGTLLSRRTVALLALPSVVTVVLTVAAAVGGPLPVVWSDYAVAPTLGAATVDYELGPWLVAVTAYSYVLLAAGLVAVGGLLASRPAYRRRALALVAVTGVPILTNAAWLLDLGPYPDLDLTAVAFAVAGGIYAHALFRQDLFETTPAARRIGRRVALDGIGDPVFILEDGLVVDANQAAENALGTTADPFGRPVEAVLGSDPVGDGPGNRPGSVTVETDRGRREFDVTVATVDGPRGPSIARTVVLHDVTDRTRRRQRIEVLNRVLRHNIRNDAGSIRGYARTLDRHTDGESGLDPVTAIEDLSQDLLDLGEKGLAIDRLLSDDRTIETVPVARVVDRAVDRVHADDTGRSPVRADGDGVAVDVPADLSVTTDDGVLTLVVENLVENAVEHGSTSDRTLSDNAVEHGSTGNQPAAGDAVEHGSTGSQAPPDDAVEHGSTHDGGTAASDAHVTVRARAAADGDGVEIVVEDDGPGIPEEELAAVQTRTETALRHGSGLGLWIVDWGSRTLGGDVSFEVEDGTRAVVSVPDWEATADGRPPAGAGSLREG